MRRLDRLAALGELLAEVVHEVRNGLVSIKTFVQLFPEHRDDPDFEERFRVVTHDEFERIERLLSSVLRQAGGGSGGGDDPQGAPPTCGARESVESVSALLRLRADRSGVNLVADCDGDASLSITADALRQVLINLLLNAVSVTTQGKEVRVAFQTLGRTGEIRVDDGGPGIPREARERIFEPFYSTGGERSTGLGLAISRHLVEDAGGTLTVRQREGGGSSFRIRIPAV